MHPMCIEGSRHPVDTLDCVVLIGIVEGQIPVVSAHLAVPVPRAALAVLSIPEVPVAQIPVVSAHLTVPVPGAALVLSIPGVIISVESSELEGVDDGNGVINFARRALKRLSKFFLDIPAVTAKMMKTW